MRCCKKTTVYILYAPTPQPKEKGLSAPLLRERIPSPEPLFESLAQRLRGDRDRQRR